MDAHRDTNEGLQAGGPPTVQLGQQSCFCLGLPPPQTSLSGQDSISKLQNLGSIQPPVQARLSVSASAQTHMHMHTYTMTHTHVLTEHTCMHSFTVTHSHTYTTPLINPQITQPIITTLVLIRNYLKHFPIRVYMLSWAGVCLDKPTGFIAGENGKLIHIHMRAHTHTHTHTYTLAFLDLTVVIRPSQRVPLLGRGG